MPELEKLLHQVNREYFQFEEVPAVKWSKGRIQKRYRKLMLGSYDIRKNEIRLHPLFREKLLPQSLLEFVIFHELLHYEDRQGLNKRRPGSRVHNRDFHLREKEHPYYEEARIMMRSLLRTRFC